MRHVKGLGSTLDTAPTVSGRVIQAVADRDGVSPLDITPPLFDAIDPDALDRLYDDGRTGVAVDFEFAGYLITVNEHGRVDLAPLSE